VLSLYSNRIIKQGLFLLAVCLLFSLVFIPGIAQAAYSDNVKDYLDHLSTEQLQDIQSKINKTIRAYDLDIAIVITNDTGGRSSVDFADDYYDSNNFGIGKDASGLLLLINMDIREVWISTSGRAIDIFTDSRIELVLDAIYPYLADDDYYHACTEFINQVERFAEMGIADDQYRQFTYTYWERAVRLMKTPVVYIVAIVISVAATLIASSGNKGKITVSSRTYEEGGSFRLIDKRDEFINQTVTRVRISSSNNSSRSSGSGGRSSVHRSSSGRIHGGGGRKF
jgi:uncharacterized protein